MLTATYFIYINTFCPATYFSHMNTCQATYFIHMNTCRATYFIHMNTCRAPHLEMSPHITVYISLYVWGRGGGGGGWRLNKPWRKRFVKQKRIVLFMAVGEVSNPLNHSWHKSETLRQPKLFERGDLNFCLPSTQTRNVTNIKSGSYLCLDKILTHKRLKENTYDDIVQELCESRGGRPGLSVLTSLLVSVDVKIYWTVLRHWSQLVPNMSTDIWGH